MPTKYYKVHGGKLTFAEYWRMCPDPLTFLIAAGMKLFGGISLDASLPRHEELLTVEYDDLPKSAKKFTRDAVDALEAAGMTLLFCHELDVLEAHRYGVGVVFLARDGRAFATVNYAKEGEVKKVELNLVTPFKDDTFGITTTAKKQFKPHPDYLSDRHPDATADELYETHQQNLDEWESDGRKPYKLTPATVPQFVLEGEQRFIDFHIERGVFVPMTKAEVRRLRDERDAREE